MRVVLAVTALAALVLFAALGAGPQVADLRLLAPHHGYTGLALIAAAVLLLGKWPTASRTWRAALWAAALAGLFLLCDDAYQHARQRLTGDLDYRSPGHQLTSLVYRIPGVRALNVWLDEITAR